MRVLVTGPRGFVGARIMEELTDAIPAPSLRTAGEDFVMRMVDETEPDLIIHTAAISDISTCEKNPEGSYHANVEVPVWLAKSGVKCVMFSTDQVYSGCSGDGPYREEETDPSNLYSRHKLEMEQRTLDINPDTVHLRATWMYDMPKYGVPNRGNFLVNMLRETDISFSTTQHRAVTYVREVAALITKAALLPGGAYNYGSENDLTMYQTAEWLKNALSLRVNIHDAGFRHHLWMDCSKIKSHGIHFCNTIDGLKQCISDYSL
ncbi:MAG: sugar nucleotide-binding protein [Eubacteriales bacterium]|nr:sugar nucleotide-binding protein [Eubacteriales bacterium]